MKRVPLPILVFVFLNPIAAHAIDVGADLAVNTQWTVADSPVNVTASIIVNQDVTLTIDPGVTVKFAGLLTVRGRLVAVGTVESPIIFDEYNIGSGWSGITFSRAGGDFVTSSVNQLQYVTMNNMTGYLYFSTRSVTVDRCTMDVEGSSRYAIVGYSNNAAVYPESQVNLTDNTITQATTSDATTVETIVLDGVNSTVTGNSITATFSGAAMSAYGVWLTRSNTDEFTGDVADNTLNLTASNAGTLKLYGIYVDPYCTADVTGNSMTLQAKNAVYGVATKEGSITGNTISVTATSDNDVMIEGDIYGIHYQSTDPSALIEGNAIRLTTDKQRFLKGILCQNGVTANNRIVLTTTGAGSLAHGIEQWYYPGTIANNSIYIAADGDQWVRGIDLSTMYTSDTITLRNNILQGADTGLSYGIYSDDSNSGAVDHGYNLIYGFTNNYYRLSESTGDLFSDPIFTDLVLLTLDDSSPAIDAGDWNSDYALEPGLNGGRINMGHLGNTANANESVVIVPPEITTNGGNDFTSDSSSVTIEGNTSSATDQVTVNGEVAGVTYTAGETTWSYTGTISPGANALSVRAIDSGLNQSVATITVTYSPAAEVPPDDAPEEEPGEETADDSGTGSSDDGTEPADTGTGSAGGTSVGGCSIVQ